VVHLHCWGLTIPEDCGIVRMDAMDVADLIDLMAPFGWRSCQQKVETLMTELVYSPKIMPEHLAAGPSST